MQFPEPSTNCASNDGNIVGKLFGSKLACHDLLMRSSIFVDVLQTFGQRERAGSRADVADVWGQMGGVWGDLWSPLVPLERDSGEMSFFIL